MVEGATEASVCEVLLSVIVFMDPYISNNS